MNKNLKNIQKENNNYIYIKNKIIIFRKWVQSYVDV